MCTPNPSVALEPPRDEVYADAAEAVIEPNLEFVGAPRFWDAGFFGQEVVLGTQDTGMDWDHPALKQQYRGWDGDLADHNYNWHDAIHSGGGSCGADSPEPCDDNGHGTFTTGVMVGDDGLGNQIGMAPGARWIGCRDMDQGNGTPATYSECFQFFIAPTDLADENPNPDLAPHAINNSWSCPPSEGCTDPNVMLEVVENTRAAGIAVVVSAQNSGPACSSIDDPAAIYEAAWSIGSTDNEGTISLFSARGPVVVDGSNRLKPDVVAPGDSIRTSRSGGGYSAISGTSLSSPHVAGLVALLISAEGCFEGDVSGMENYMKATTLPATSFQNCGDVLGSEVPNNTYGYGSIQAELPTPLDCSMSVQISGDCPGELTVALTGGTPNGSVGIAWSPIEGFATVPAGPCAGTELGLEDPRLVRFIQVDADGIGSFSGPAPAGACGAFMEAIDMESCRTSNVADAPE